MDDPRVETPMSLLVLGQGREFSERLVTTLLLPIQVQSLRLGRGLVRGGMYFSLEDPVSSPECEH